MGIVFHESGNVFHIMNRGFSYIFMVLKNGQLGQLYFGAPLADRDGFEHMLVAAHRDMAPCPFKGDGDFSMEDIKQEYPVNGNGDLRNVACVIETPDGARNAAFRYVSHRILPGKPTLDGLPATYVEYDDEAETLEITLRDDLLDLRMILSYTTYRDLPVLTRNVRFVNDSIAADDGSTTGGADAADADGTVTLRRALSASLDLPDARWSMMQFTGAWGRERRPQTFRLHTGVQEIYSLRGHSSHQFNPFLILKRPNTNESAGEAIGAALVYSGNFLGSVEVDNYHVTRLMMGIHPEGFAWTLRPGETFQTPEMVVAYTRDGLNALSQSFHTLFRTRLARGYWRDRPRPILINSWESTYMRFDEAKLLSIAGKAHELGIDLFVLDDGWFGHRDDATSSLGDWTADRRKLPDGVEGLARKINDLGMMFGLWFEPEMVSRDSDLYRAHPDWMIRVPGREPLQGRNQYELDLSKSEVVDYLFDSMSAILASGRVSYVKWDMNRSITDVFSQGRPAAFQGELLHRQILGVYALYERLTSALPKVLFESCASGGARFDPGMLYYAPQGWISDDTDAAERVKIQFGTSYAYPVSSMGSHVSAVPNHQLMRVTPLKTRADVAYFGTFGYELDVNRMTDGEQEQMRRQIAFMKSHRELIDTGDFFRLISPFDESEVGLQPGAEAAWMVVSADRRHALVGYYRMIMPVNEGYRTLRLAGLDPAETYTVRDTEFPLPASRFTYGGDELMARGFDISDTGFGPFTTDMYQGDYLTRLFEVDAV
ncbi:alpha-galactosidase [Bifidobacterium simiiventris]|uniref:alpha-galactosidase n=1 Tax=Bifidobacterium simiiventris TaxID=2834434 RepID=UPI001C55B11A|nr:alpha-galactosidase [Bifidobacterium simiiventris]MBW3077756.1 alpha-galactosidase [Bifidobacterium simiiventris]